jgi:hypothetical protein
MLVIQLIELILGSAEEDAIELKDDAVGRGVDLRGSDVHSCREIKVIR